LILNFDQTFADLTYNSKKLELASRIAQNREKRIQLQKELKEYQRIEKTGKKSFEDPQKRQEILKIQETIEMESKLTIQLEEQVKGIQENLKEHDKQIINLSNMIQKNKEEKQLGSFDSNLFIESRSLQLQEKEEQLSKLLKTKEQKIYELKDEIERIKEEIQKSTQEKNIIKLVENWKNGQTPDESDLQKTAYQLFKTAADMYNDAKQSIDAEILDAYYRQIRISLLSAIDCVYILVTNSLERFKLIDYFEKIDELFAKKIVVNPIMIEKLDNLVQKIEDGVEISPNLRFRDDVFEYLEKNLRSLKIL
jgi:hypothetical protein